MDSIYVRIDIKKSDEVVEQLRDEGIFFEEIANVLCIERKQIIEINEENFKRQIEAIKRKYDDQLNFYILCKKQHLKKVEKELYTEPYKRLKERYIVRDYEHIIDIYRNPLLHIGNDFFNINSYL